MQDLRFLTAMLMKVQLVRMLQCVGWPAVSTYKLTQRDIPKGLDLQNSSVMENTQLSCLRFPHTNTRRGDKECEKRKIWYWARDCNLAVNFGLLRENYSLLKIIWRWIGNFWSGLRVTSYTLTSRFTRGMFSSKVIDKVDNCYPKLKSLLHTHTRCKRKMCEPQMETLLPLLPLVRCFSLAAKPHLVLSVLLVLAYLLKEVIM